ncbi:hypothetical protein NL676_007168 [Syzygium grande]|nr:hypothetical protein NL676_007168 [Syzygium grande]
MWQRLGAETGKAPRKRKEGKRWFPDDGRRRHGIAGGGRRRMGRLAADSVGLWQARRQLPSRCGGRRRGRQRGRY